MSAKRLQEPSRILRGLPKERAFHFFTSAGNYTGENAAALEEFSERIKEIDVKSLEFHLCRGDFEEWTAKTLEDEELAEEILDLRNIMPTRDILRKRLVTIVSKRRENLLAQEAIE